MKLTTKMLASGALALCALAATAPASAQVQGRIATADVAGSILGTTSFQNGYNQIVETYSAQIEQRQTKQQQLTQLLQPFDTNGNGQLDEAELPAVQNSPSFTQIQTLEQEVAGLTQQVQTARIFVVEQILVRYPEALGEVATQQQVVMVLQPEVLQFAGQGADISALISASLNTKVPSVQVVPPADYRPSREGAQILSDIQVMLVRVQQQQAAQQQQATQAPAGR